MKPAILPALILSSLALACSQPLEPPADPAAKRIPPSVNSSVSGAAGEIAWFYCDLSWGEDGIPLTGWGLNVTYADGGAQAIAGGEEWCNADHRAAWSPDAARIAFTDNNGEISAVSIADGRTVNLTNHPANDRAPAWSPDGSRIAFLSNRDGPGDLYLMDADGSNVRRIQHGGQVDYYYGNPAWSPDGTRIAFTCATGSGRAICVINADGTGLVVLTGGSGEDYDPDWSPDGSRIAFLTEFRLDWYPYPVYQLAVMNADGLSVTLLGPQSAQHPDWSPDGSRIVFTQPAGSCDASSMCEGTIYVINADGSGLQTWGSGHGAAWAPVSPPRPPAGTPPQASFAYSCNRLSCSFDGSSSYADGGIVSWWWNFGDGQTATGSLASHTWATPGTWPVTLTVTDANGYSDMRTLLITPDSPPFASFGYSCNGLACTFYGSQSRDDYGIVAWSWNFGDGHSGTGSTPSHTYGQDGRYLVTLTVSDASGQTSSTTSDVTLTRPIVPALEVVGSILRGQLAVADLAWTGATGASVDIFRNGGLLVTTANDGSYRDQLGRRARGSFTYRLCNAGTSTCSEVVTVTF